MSVIGATVSVVDPKHAGTIAVRGIVVAETARTVTVETEDGTRVKVQAHLAYVNRLPAHN